MAGLVFGQTNMFGVTEGLVITVLSIIVGFCTRGLMCYDYGEYTPVDGFILVISLVCFCVFVYMTWTGM